MCSENILFYYLKAVKLVLFSDRAGPGRVEAFFAGPDPGPQGRATSSLALASGQEGRARAGSEPPWPFDI